MTTTYRTLDPKKDRLQSGDEFLSYTWAVWLPIDPRSGRERPNPSLEYRRKIPAPEVAAGAGYRLLSSDDDMIQEGDEYFHASSATWKVTKSAGTKIGYFGSPYRRKLPIDPDPGYRLLGREEILQKGDEFFLKPYSIWRLTESAGSQVKDSGGLVYRRKLPVVATTTTTYRLLQPGEIIAEGDEFEGRGGWQKVKSCFGLKIYPYDVGNWRRPVPCAAIDPAPSPQEIATLRKELDEAKQRGREWEEAHYARIDEVKHLRAGNSVLDRMVEDLKRRNKTLVDAHLALKQSLAKVAEELRAV